MMDWDLMRVVLAIARAGSIQGAAEALGMDRATVQRRLDAAEATLDARLFDRRRDGCVPTEAGARILAPLEQIAETITSVRHRVVGEGGGRGGRVLVTVPEFFAEKVLVPEMPGFARRHPGVSIDLHCGHRMANLSEGEADVALRNRLPDRAALVGRRVGEVAVGLFAHRDYIARHGKPREEDFTGHRMILLGRELAHIPGAAWVEDRAASAQVAMRCNELGPIRTAIRAGLGIGCMPVALAAGEPDFIAIPPGIVGRPEIYLITHRDLRGRGNVRAVHEFIAGLCQKHAATLSGAWIEARGGGPARGGVA